MEEKSKEVRRMGRRSFFRGMDQMEDGTVRQAVETVLPYKYLRLSRPNIETKVFQEADGYTICLKSDCFAAFVELSFQDADVIFQPNIFPYYRQANQRDLYTKE